MSIITTPEFFINMKSIPDPLSRDYDAFFEEEKRKIREGVTINGVRVPGWLYWHVNHWKIDVDMPPDPITKYIERKTMIAQLRDNEWLIGEEMDLAEKNHQGLLIVGSRQLGKSEFGGSYMGRRAIGFQNTQNIVAGLSDPDLTLLTSKIARGFLNLHSYFKPLTPLKDWKKRVVIGYKDSNGSGELNVFSEILIRNLSGGNNTENLAGPTTSALLLDEVGKDDFLEAFIGARPALETPYGWRCSPIFTGTSGSFEKSADLENFYSKLDVFNFRCVHMLDEKGRPINFIPGFQASKCGRKKIRLSTFLGKEMGSELDKIAIRVVTDKDKAIAEIKTSIEDLKSKGEVTLALKEQMYFPLTQDDLFRTNEKDNPFADIKEDAKEHLKYLESIKDETIKYGFMIRDAEGKVGVSYADKLPIQDFPADENEDKDAPIIFFDDPIQGTDLGILHVAGADPYNQDQSFYSSSLGCLYIFRRMYDALNGRFQYSIVACYAARPKSIGRWQEQCRLLLEYYNATCLPENEDASFIRYFDEKNIGYYIEDGFQLAKEINPNTKNTRVKGLSGSTGNQRYGNGLLKNYCAEDIVVGQTPDGQNIIKRGVVRIKDKALLKEIIAYKPGMNVDRIVAFRHALILSSNKDKYHPIAKVSTIKTKEEKKKTITHSPFSTRKAVMTPFSTRRPGIRRKL